MRRRFCIAIFAALIICTIAIFAFTGSAYAESNNEEIEKELEENVKENLDKLDLKELEEWAQSLENKSVFSDGVK